MSGHPIPKRKHVEFVLERSFVWNLHHLSFQTKTKNAANDKNDQHPHTVRRSDDDTDNTVTYNNDTKSNNKEEGKGKGGG